MSAATSTIIAGIALGAGTGAQLYGAHRAGKAADKAAQLQSDAADRALAVQQQQHEQTRTDLAPYRGAGESSLSALTAFLGLPPTAAPAAPAAAPAPPGRPDGGAALAGAAAAADAGRRGDVLRAGPRVCRGARESAGLGARDASRAQRADQTGARRSSRVLPGARRHAGLNHGWWSGRSPHRHS